MYRKITIDLSFKCLLIATTLLLPAISYAWGPAVHYSWSASLLDALFVISGGGILRLITSRMEHFLYGTVIADVVIGKNLAPPEEHSHNWEVINALKDRCTTEEECVVVKGILAHLAADTVAHNVFLPFFILKSRLGLSIDHAILEAMVERRVGRKPMEDLQRLLAKDFDSIDRFIDTNIKKTIFKSFETNKYILKRAAFNKDLTNWIVRVRSQISGIDEELLDELLPRMRSMAFLRMKKILLDDFDGTVWEDPSGVENIKMARNIAKALKSRQLAGQKRRIERFKAELGTLIFEMDPYEWFMPRVIALYEKHFS